MNKQVIISIGREYGAGGHIIAENIAKEYGLPLYDKAILKNIAKEKNININELEKFDERPKNRLFTRTISGYSSSPEEIVANMEFDFLKEKADSGESFVVVGRCANSILKDYECLITVFVNGNMPEKVKKTMEEFNICSDEAEKLVLKKNKMRKSYHNFYCKEKWGDSRYYELNINSSRIGIDATSSIVKAYIESRTK